MAIGNDEELFDAAMSREPEKPEPDSTPEAPPVNEGQPRDENGRFAAKGREEPEGQPEPDAAEQPATETEPAATPEPRQDHRVPVAELKAEREKRQSAERAAEELRQRMDALQRQVEHISRPPPPPAEPVEQPDPYADPQGFRDFGVKQAITPLEQRLEDQRLQFSRMYAADKFGEETVNAAFSAIETALRSDPRTRFEYQRIMASPHPYGELVNWHRRQEALREVGDDPQAYRKRVLEEASKDPEFVRAIVEAARQQAQQPAPNGQPRPTTVSLPPSLNRATGSGGQAVDAMPKNDAEMFSALYPQR